MSDAQFVMNDDAIAQEEHVEDTFTFSFSDYGIEKLPLITKRRKQDFSDLLINDEGDIDVDSDEDDVYDISQEEFLNFGKKTNPTRTSSKRKQKVIETTNKPVKKRKITDNIKNKNVLACDQCSSTFTRKDNLICHIRNKHNKVDYFNVTAKLC